LPKDIKIVKDDKNSEIGEFIVIKDNPMLDAVEKKRHNIRLKYQKILVEYRDKCLNKASTVINEMKVIKGVN